MAGGWRNQNQRGEGEGGCLDQNGRGQLWLCGEKELTWVAAVVKKKIGEKIGLGFFLLYFSGVSKISLPCKMTPPL